MIAKIRYCTFLFLFSFCLFGVYGQLFMSFLTQWANGFREHTRLQLEKLYINWRSLPSSHRECRSLWSQKVYSTWAFTLSLIHFYTNLVLKAHFYYFYILATRPHGPTTFGSLFLQFFYDRTIEIVNLNGGQSFSHKPTIFFFTIYSQPHHSYDESCSTKVVPKQRVWLVVSKIEP